MSRSPLAHRLTSDETIALGRGRVPQSVVGALIRERRAGCDVGCSDWRKPCERCDAYADGVNALARLLA